MPPSRTRFDRLRRRLARRFPVPPPAQLTLFLVPASADRPVGQRVCWDGVALEIAYDPAVGPRLPPGGPHKILLGPAVEV